MEMYCLNDEWKCVLFTSSVWTIVHERVHEVGATHFVEGVILCDCAQNFDLVESGPGVVLCALDDLHCVCVGRALHVDDLPHGGVVPPPQLADHLVAPVVDLVHVDGVVAPRLVELGALVLRLLSDGGRRRRCGACGNVGWCGDSFT